MGAEIEEAAIGSVFFGTTIFGSTFLGRASVDAAFAGPAIELTLAI